MQDKDFEVTSTADSTSIYNKTVLTNSTPGTQRQATVSASVDSEVSIAMSCDVSSVGDTTASITAPLAEHIDLGTSNVALQITDSFVTANHVLVYDNAVTPLNPKHLIAKEYADNNFYNNSITLD